MEIKLVDKKCWQIKTKKEIILIDPEAEMLKENKTLSRIVLFTEEPKMGVRLADDGVIKIAGPGEYEVGGVEVLGLGGKNNDRVYTIMADGVTIGILGKLKEMLPEKRIERINSVDVLVVNIGAGGVLTVKQIMKLAKGWGANYVVPIGYEAGSETLKKFLDETDNEGLEPVEWLKVEREELPEGMEVVILK